MLLQKWAAFEEGQGHLYDAEQLLARGLAAAPGATQQAFVHMDWAEFSARQGEVDQALEQAAAAVESGSGAMANVRRIVRPAQACLLLLAEGRQADF